MLIMSPYGPLAWSDLREERSRQDSEQGEPGNAVKYLAPSVTWKCEFHLCEGVEAKLLMTFGQHWLMTVQLDSSPLTLNDASYWHLSGEAKGCPVPEVTSLRLSTWWLPAFRARFVDTGQKVLGVYEFTFVLRTVYLLFQCCFSCAESLPKEPIISKPNRPLSRRIEHYKAIVLFCFIWGEILDCKELPVMQETWIQFLV